MLLPPAVSRGKNPFWRLLDLRFEPQSFLIETGTLLLAFLPKFMPAHCIFMSSSTCLFHLLVALKTLCADGGTGFCHKPNMTLHDANAWFMQYNAAVHRMFLQQNAKCIQFHCHIRHTSMDVEARKASAQERANPSNLPCFAGHVWMESGIMAGLIGMASFPL